MGGVSSLLSLHIISYLNPVHLFTSLPPVNRSSVTHWTSVCLSSVLSSLSIPFSVCLYVWNEAHNTWNAWCTGWSVSRILRRINSAQSIHIVLLPNHNIRNLYTQRINVLPVPQEFVPSVHSISLFPSHPKCWIRGKGHASLFKNASEWRVMHVQPDWLLFYRLVLQANCLCCALVIFWLDVSFFLWLRDSVSRETHSWCLEAHIITCFINMASELSLSLLSWCWISRNLSPLIPSFAPSLFSFLLLPSCYSSCLFPFCSMKVPFIKVSFHFHRLEDDEMVENAMKGNISLPTDGVRENCSIQWYVVSLCLLLLPDSHLSFSLLVNSWICKSYDIPV